MMYVVTNLKRLQQKRWKMEGLEALVIDIKAVSGKYPGQRVRTYNYM